jgi:hypothetical protein
MRVRSHRICNAVSPSHEVTVSKSALSRTRARPTEEVTVQSLRFVRSFLAIAIDEGCQLRGVLIALHGELLAEDTHVRFIAMSSGNLAIRIGQH